MLSADNPNSEIKSYTQQSENHSFCLHEPNECVVHNGQKFVRPTRADMLALICSRETV